jgi:hypothetical protein
VQHELKERRTGDVAVSRLSRRKPNAGRRPVGFSRRRTARAGGNRPLVRWRHASRDVRGWSGSTLSRCSGFVRGGANRRTDDLVRSGGPGSCGSAALGDGADAGKQRRDENRGCYGSVAAEHDFAPKLIKRRSVLLFPRWPNFSMGRCKPVLLLLAARPLCHYCRCRTRRPATTQYL